MASNTRGKRFIYYTLGFLVVVVFLVFYFRDPADTAKIEKEQILDIEEKQDSLFNQDFDFSETTFSEDTIESDSLK